MGVSVHTLLIGRLDGSLAFIEVIDYTSYRRVELQECGRKDGRHVYVETKMDVK